MGTATPVNVPTTTQQPTVSKAEVDRIKKEVRRAGDVGEGDRADRRRALHPDEPGEVAVEVPPGFSPPSTANSSTSPTSTP
ncbi:hypothetical protein LV779_30575 [Streptomyces thinghirensis]|nr:hypothetical protein [Streptomyces thinghirensis]